MRSTLRHFGPIEGGRDTVHLAAPGERAFCKPLTCEEITQVLGTLEKSGYGNQLTHRLIEAGIVPARLCAHCFPRDYRKMYEHGPAVRLVAGHGQ